jgi:hypothetical protein
MDNNVLNDLLLTKALSDYADKKNKELRDVIDDVFADGALDRDEYLHSVLELTKAGYIESDLENEEDIEMSEAVGYDIKGLTSNGNEYVEELLHQPTAGERVKKFFKEFDAMCGKVADSGPGKLAGTVIFPLLSILL